MKNYIQHFNNSILYDDGLRAISEKLAGDIKLELIQGLSDHIADRNQIKESEITKSVIKYYGIKLKGNNEALRSLYSEKVYSSFLKTSAFERGIDLNSNENVLQQINFRKDYKFAKRALKDSLLPSLIDLLSAAASASESNAPNKYLNLILEKVECIKTTDGPGDDEIFMGGSKIYQSGQTMSIPKFHVKDFEEKIPYDTKIFGYSIAKYPISPQVQFPQISTAIIALAEVDNEGFADFLTTLTSVTRNYVYNALAEAGCAIGASVGSIFGPIGTIVGLVVAYIVLEIIDFLIGCLRDDIFKPVTISMNLGSPNCNFDGRLTSPMQHIHFSDHGGHYRATAHWQLIPV